MFATNQVMAADGNPAEPRVLGDPNAPVTILEFSSLTCSHCAAFHRETFPEIKKKYIDTGKVKVVYRDFPLEPRAMAGSLIARCLPENQYFGFLEVLFRSQQKWAGAKDPLAELEKLSRLAGMSKKDFDACVQNAALFQGIQVNREKDSKEFKIESTPSFVINGEKLVGAAPFAEFEKVIEDKLN